MTTENNKLIAEFMGLNKQKMFFNLKSCNYVKNENDDCEVNAVEVFIKNNKPIVNFNYHSDWNWLMEVVTECKRKQANAHKNLMGNIYDALHNTDIRALYNACIEFIQWYNQNGAKEN